MENKNAIMEVMALVSMYMDYKNEAPLITK